VEYNGKLSIYNNCPDKEWPLSKVMLVNDVVVLIFSMTGRLTASKRDIIRFQHGASQMISVEKENRGKRNKRDSANGGYNSVKEREEAEGEGEIATKRGGHNTGSTQANCTHVHIEEPSTPEPHDLPKCPRGFERG
jgi:hypothetical protein